MSWVISHPYFQISLGSSQENLILPFYSKSPIASRQTSRRINNKNSFYLENELEKHHSWKVSNSKITTQLKSERQKKKIYAFVHCK